MPTPPHHRLGNLLAWILLLLVGFNIINLLLELFGLLPQPQAVDITSPRIWLVQLSDVLLRGGLIVLLGLRYRALQARPKRWSWLLLIPIAAALEFAFRALEGALQIPTPSNPTADSILEGGPALLVIAVVLFNGLLLAPLSEELLFREWLPRTLPVFAGILPNALLFTLGHDIVRDTPAESLTFIVRTFVWGCAFWLARRWSGSVWYAAGLHVLANFFSFSFFLR